MAKVNIKPIGDRVLVQHIEEKEQVRGGIIIPDSAKEKPQEAKVIALGTGKEQKITIQGSSGLSKDEVEKMTKEAELNAAEDAKRKEAVETKNQLDTTIYQLEKTLKDAGDKLPADVKTKFESALTDAKKELESNDPAKMKVALENLQKVGAELYQQAQAAQAAAGAQPGAEPSAAAGGDTPQPKKAQKAEGKVVDADVEIVEDEKK